MSLTEESVDIDILAINETGWFAQGKSVLTPYSATSVLQHCPVVFM